MSFHPVRGFFFFLKKEKSDLQIKCLWILQVFMHIFCIHKIMNVKNRGHKLYVKKSFHKVYHFYSIM